MGGKVNRAASKTLRGPEEGRDCSVADSPGRRRRAGKATQVTAAFRPVTQVMVTIPSRLKGFRGSRGNGGTGQSSASIMRLKRCPGACADRVLSRPRGDSRCHRSHPPPRGPLTTRSGTPRSRLSPLASRLRPPPLLRKRPPARPAAAGSGRGRSPPPAGRLTSSSGSSSSFSRSRRRYSRRWRHFRPSRPSSSALHRRPGRKVRPLG